MKRVAMLAFIISLGAMGLTARSDAPATGPGAEVGKINQTFLAGPWEELVKQLTALPKDGAGLSAADKTDLTYIAQAVQEGRPPWWKQCKTGKTAFKAALWGRTIPVAYDPAGKQSLQLLIAGGTVKATLAWPQGDMDNEAEAEHGFSKGELNALGVWQTLGMADAWANAAAGGMFNLTEAQNQQLNRFLDFRGNLTGVYYAPPRSRRWGLWLACAAYMDKYAKMPTVMGRKALAAMFVAEVLGHREKYPSIELPASFPPDKAEEKLALHLKDWLEKHTWTVPEDRTLREALRAFAAANEKAGRENAKVSLPNGLVVALDPTQDADNQTRRDAWLKMQWDMKIKQAK